MKESDISIYPPSAAGLELGTGSATAEHTRVCKTSCLPRVQLPGVPILQKEILPNTIFLTKLSVEMQRVLLYYGKRIFYWRGFMGKKINDLIDAAKGTEGEIL